LGVVFVGGDLTGALRIYSSIFITLSSNRIQNVDIMVPGSGKTFGIVALRHSSRDGLLMPKQQRESTDGSTVNHDHHQ